MQTLRELQHGFVTALFDERNVQAHAQICNGRFTGARLLQVYRHNVFISLTAALAAVYPAVQRLVGEGFFKYAADAFIHAHPPTSGNLHDFGAGLAEFLAAFPACAEHAYLPDVARLEWAYHAVFHAAAPRFDVAALAGVSPERYPELRFGLSPAARLIASEYPLLALWRAHQAGAAETPIDLDAGGDRLLVFRRELEVEFKRLSVGEYALLAAWQHGATLQAASDAAHQAETDFDLTRCLQQHVALGTITNSPTSF